MPSANLKCCFSLQGVRDFSVPVGLDDKAQVDLVVVGSVAVSEKGKEKLPAERSQVAEPDFSLELSCGLGFCPCVCPVPAASASGCSGHTAVASEVFRKTLEERILCVVKESKQAPCHRSALLTQPV